MLRWPGRPAAGRPSARRGRRDRPVPHRRNSHRRTGQPASRVPGIRAAVLAGHADNDGSNTPEQIAVFDTALRDAGLDHRTAVYPDAVHGYTMADTAAYQEAGAERHFHELRELFARTLTR
ncbi:dienelactone hydrolase family protein [Nocardia rhamnosiphila]|uniref:dienelactone hydrolase family protein n=1 Tax=Nocardia rhamnosiphila TaxID=426716 RepID=UPI0033FFC77D